MEPFYQLAVDATTDIRGECAKLGIVTKWSDEPLLVEGFRTLICERADERTAISIGPCCHDPNQQILVYVNRQHGDLTRDIRQQLESVGATWGYYEG